MNQIPPSARELAYVRFGRALLDFSDEPTPRNVVRYLKASRELDRLSAGSARSKVARRDETQPRVAA
jgi:hypothetical protein